jgi:hypothetical protein
MTAVAICEIIINVTDVAVCKIIIQAPSGHGERTSLKGIMAIHRPGGARASSCDKLG